MLVIKDYWITLALKMLDAKDKIYMWPIIHFGLQSLSRTCLTSLV